MAGLVEPTLALEDAVNPVTNEPKVMVTSYSVCKLPEEHPDWWEAAVHVEYRGNDLWVVLNEQRQILNGLGEWVDQDEDELDYAHGQTMNDALEMAKEACRANSKY